MFSWRSLKENEELAERFPILENGRLIQDLSGIHRLVILWENAWKLQPSRARENYRKTFRKTSYSLSFSWCWITCDERRVFLEFTEGEQ